MDAEDVLLRAFLGALRPEVLRPDRELDPLAAARRRNVGELLARAPATSPPAWRPTRRCGSPATRPTRRTCGARANGSSTRAGSSGRGRSPACGWRCSASGRGTSCRRCRPEMVFFPRWFPLNPYDFGCWARQTIVPADDRLGARSRCAGSRSTWPSSRSGAPPRSAPAACGAGRGGSSASTTSLRAYDRRPHRGLRRAALRTATEWILRRQEADGSWGGIQPPWVYSMIALDLMGYRARPPGDARRLRRAGPLHDPRARPRRPAAGGVPVTRLGHVPGDHRRWPTRACRADHPALIRGADWMLGEEIRARATGRSGGRTWSRAGGRSSSPTTRTPTSTTPPR